MPGIIGFLCGIVVGVVLALFLSVVVNAAEISEQERRNYPDRYL